VRAAAELGVDRIVPLITERLQGRPDAAARAAVVARWQSVADAALEQSRGVHRTQVDPVVGIDALDPAALLAPDACRGLVTVPGAPDLATVLATGDPRGGRVGGVAVAVGPEGGWTDGERAALVGLGWEPAGLGRTVLRTEHAGPVALAVVAALTGRWADEG
jgi:16S rRNA (uracil1498-N3)-methyltransferase